MVIPARARKEARITTGDVVSVEPEGDGRLLLIRLDKPKTAPRGKPRLVSRKGKHPVIVGAPKISDEQLREALADFP